MKRPLLLAALGALVCIFSVWLLVREKGTIGQADCSEIVKAAWDDGYKHGREAKAKPQEFSIRIGMDDALAAEFTGAVYEDGAWRPACPDGTWGSIEVTCSTKPPTPTPATFDLGTPDCPYMELERGLPSAPTIGDVVPLKMSGRQWVAVYIGEATP